MRDYSYQDMLKMQEEAAARVREMQKRATIAMEEDEPKPKKIPLPEEVKHISYPVEIPKNEVIAKPESKPEGLLDVISKDRDASLILPLVALLSQESDNYITTLSLLYLLL